MYCEKCGTYNEGDSRFCVSCGNVIQQFGTGQGRMVSGGDYRSQCETPPLAVGAVPAGGAQGRPASRTPVVIAGIVAAAIVAIVIAVLVFMGVTGFGQATNKNSTVTPVAQSATTMSPSNGSATNVPAPSEPSAPAQSSGASSDDSAPAAPAPAASTGASQSFWGVWVGAFESESLAYDYAANARAKGFDAQVLLSSDWANLNQNPYYVVTVGKHKTEAEANAVLARAKSINADAYVKYSGSHK